MYLLDANFFIDAKNKYYGFDITPSFWLFLRDMFDRAEVCSIIPVYHELKNKGDELSQWARENREIFLDPDTPEAARCMRELILWTENREPKYTPEAKAKFSGNQADFRLIAYAMEHGHVVVSHEVPDPKSKKRVKIPDACVAMGVDFINPFVMLRQLGMRL